MNEYPVRQRPRHEDAQTGTTTGRKRISLTVVQIGLCVIGLGTALVLKQFGGTYYKTAQSFVKDAMQKNLTSEEVMATLHNVRDKWFPEASEVFGRGITSSQQSEAAKSSSMSQPAGASSAPGTSSAKPSSSAAQNSSKTASSSAGKAPATATKTAVKMSELSFAALDDQSAVQQIPAGESLLPPDGVSLSPIKLSIKPVMPVKGRFTSAYGYRINPVSGKHTFHTGVDIAAARGTPIAAAYAGKVAQVGKSDAYGNFVLLSHAGGISTFYGHCDTVSAKQGDIVKAGEVIATVGSTGMSTGYHLHFEIRVQNVEEDPQWII